MVILSWFSCRVRQRNSSGWTYNWVSEGFDFSFKTVDKKAIK